MGIFEYKKRSSGFTLVEVMILMVVLSLVLASSVSLITRKHTLKPRKAIHGEYACFREQNTDKKREIMYTGRRLVFDRELADDENCSFTPPKNTTYLYMHLVGGGGAGGHANFDPWKGNSAFNVATDVDVQYIPNVNLPSDWSGNFNLATYYGTTWFGHLGYGQDGYACFINLMGEKFGSQTGCGKTGRFVDNSLSPLYETFENIVYDKMNRAYSGDMTGVTPEYIHSKKYGNIKFSARAFNKIMKDNNVKFFAYDFAGNGGNGGSGIVHQFEKSTYEPTLADVNLYEDWPIATCANLTSDTDERTSSYPASCLKRAIENNWAVPGLTSGFANTIGTPNLYCQFRYPLSVNCPVLKAYMKPIASTEGLKCGGGGGGTGGALTTPVKDYAMKTGYQLGLRFSGISDNYKSASAHDDYWIGAETSTAAAGGFTCDSYLSTSISGITAGSLISKGEYAPGMPDVSGNEIKGTILDDGTYIYGGNGSDLRYFDTDIRQQEVQTGDCPDGDDCKTETVPIQANLAYRDIFPYSTTPRAQYFFKQGGAPQAQYSVSVLPCRQGDSNVVGGNDGKDGKLPFFPNIIGTNGKPKVGVRLYYKGQWLDDASLKNWPDTDEAMRQYTNPAGSPVSGVVTATGAKGVKDGDPQKFLKDYDHTSRTASTGYRDETITTCQYSPGSGTGGTSGNKTINWPSGDVHFCYRNVCFAHNDGVHLRNRGARRIYNLNGFAYSPDGAGAVLPYKRSATNAVGAAQKGHVSAPFDYEMYERDVSLQIYPRFERATLSYGMPGQAGEHRALFIRAGEQANFVMEPAKGGKVDNPQDESDGNRAPVERRRSTQTGTNGETTGFGAGCTGDTMDSCAEKYLVAGGKAGKSYVKEHPNGVSDWEYSKLTNKDIYELVNSLKEDVGHFTSRNSKNFDDSSYVGEDSEFQRYSVLTDLSNIGSGLHLINLGKGGNGGYVEHRCWVLPFYFAYLKESRYDVNFDNTSWDVRVSWNRANNGDGDYGRSVAAVPNVDAGEYDDTDITDANGKTMSEWDEWEGYTMFTEGQVLSLCREAHPEFASETNYRNMYKETDGTNGYGGGIVILW